MDKSLFKKLCTPAKIYFAIAVIASIIALINGVTFGAILVKLVFAFFWTYILGWLCNKGFKSISWFLVLLPYFVILLAALGIANITQHKSIFRSLGIQGAYGREAFREGMEWSMDGQEVLKGTPNAFQFNGKYYCNCGYPKVSGKNECKRDGNIDTMGQYCMPEGGAGGDGQ